jgi:hypothetical protein
VASEALTALPTAGQLALGWAIKAARIRRSSSSMFAVTVFTTLLIDEFLQIQLNHCPFTHALVIMTPQQAPGGPGRLAR